MIQVFAWVHSRRLLHWISLILPEYALRISSRVRFRLTLPLTHRSPEAGARHRSTVLLGPLPLRRRESGRPNAGSSPCRAATAHQCVTKLIPHSRTQATSRDRYRMMARGRARHSLVSSNTGGPCSLSPFGVRAEHTWVGRKPPTRLALRGSKRTLATSLPDREVRRNSARRRVIYLTPRSHDSSDFWGFWCSARAPRAIDLERFRVGCAVPVSSAHRGVESAPTGTFAW